MRALRLRGGAVAGRGGCGWRGTLVRRVVITRTYAVPLWADRPGEGAIGMLCRHGPVPWCDHGACGRSCTSLHVVVSWVRGPGSSFLGHQG